MIRRPPRSTLFPYNDALPICFAAVEKQLYMGPKSIAFLMEEIPWFNAGVADRKSTRLNSSHSQISYAVFCLKKKKTRRATPPPPRQRIPRRPAVVAARGHRST